MTGRLRVAMGLCLGLGLVLTLVLPVGTQEKEPEKGKTALQRVEGAIQSVDKAATTPPEGAGWMTYGVASIPRTGDRWEILPPK